jgi:hypothetical protein
VRISQAAKLAPAWSEFADETVGTFCSRLAD